MSVSYRKIKLNNKGYGKQIEVMKNIPRNRLHNALLTLNYVNTNELGTTAAERH